jgi:hypothetical protein
MYPWLTDCQNCGASRSVISSALFYLLTRRDVEIIDIPSLQKWVECSCDTPVRLQ